MKTNDNAWANGYADFVLRFRWFIIVFLLAATIAGALFIPQLDIHPTTRTRCCCRATAMSRPTRYAGTQLRHGQPDGVLPQGEGGDIWQPWFINKIQEITTSSRPCRTRARRTSSISPQKIKYMGTDENGLVFKRLIRPRASATTRKRRKSNWPSCEGVKTNPSWRRCWCPCGTQGQSLRLRGLRQGLLRRQGRLCDRRLHRRGEGDLPPWVREVRAMMDEVRPGPARRTAGCRRALLPRVDVGGSGRPLVVVRDLDRYRHGVLWLEFRDWRGAAFPLLGVGMTIAMTLGLMGFTAFKLTTMMVLTPMLLLAIGIGHSVQVTRRFLLEARAEW